MQIRAAEHEDWPAVWPTFQEIVAAGETYAYPEQLASAEAEALWLEPAPVHVATASFMVASGARGRGVGRALGEYVLHWAAANGYRAMQFNAVVETNLAAVGL